MWSVVKMRSVENECSKLNAEWWKRNKELDIDYRPEKKIAALSTIILKITYFDYFSFPFYSNIATECGKRGICNMEVNK